MAAVSCSHNSASSQLFFFRRCNARPSCSRRDVRSGTPGGYCGSGREEDSQRLPHVRNLRAPKARSDARIVRTEGGAGCTLRHVRESQKGKDVRGGVERKAHRVRYGRIATCWCTAATSDDEPCEGGGSAREGTRS